MARALRRWEGEGGHLATEAAGLVLGDAERNILQCLGAAAVLTWNDLPMPIQRALFLRATAVRASYDPLELKTQIARFLHNHKDDGSDDA
ncbi:hypothetical protein [Ferrovibrio sp.]|uniref:hypothetical protein n=1 Tax=Ferrovibrio sp. TaxID=1917215 RepID=UPI002611CE37|nr:hypothetical protein [Ferrovibrio sp.]